MGDDIIQADSTHSDEPVDQPVHCWAKYWTRDPSHHRKKGSKSLSSSPLKPIKTITRATFIWISPSKNPVRMIWATLLISLSCLSLYNLGSGVRYHDPEQVTGESLLLQQREHLVWWDPGPDSSNIPPRNASLGCHPLNPLPLRNLHTRREPQVPIPSPRTPPPPTGPPVTLLPSYPPPAGSLQLPSVTSHLPPRTQPTHSPLGYPCTTLLQPLPDQDLTSSPLPHQVGGCRLLEQERTESQS